MIHMNSSRLKIFSQTIDIEKNRITNKHRNLQLWMKSPLFLESFRLEPYL